MTVVNSKPIDSMTGLELSEALPHGACKEIGKTFKVGGNYVAQILKGTVAKRKNPKPSTIEKRTQIIKEARKYLKTYRLQIAQAEIE